MFNTSCSRSKQILSLFTSRWALLCYACLTVMEVISASSSLWLVLIMEKITAQEEFTHILYLYLGSLLIPSLPWCIAYICSTSWKQEAQRAFINSFVTSNRNNIGEWGSKTLKEQKMSILMSEGPMALNLAVDYAFSVYSFSISIIFNILALSIVVEPLFSVAFCTSVLMVMGVMKIRRARQKQLTQKALSARIDLTQSLMGAWDNVLLGNHYNFSIWKERTFRKVNRCLQKNVELERFDQTMAIIVSLLTMIPSLIVTVWFCYKHQNNMTELASFFVTLPILFLILSYTYQTLSNVFRWGMHKNKLTALFDTIQPATAKPEEMIKKIQWPKIKYTKNESANDAAYQGSRKFCPPKDLVSHHDLILHSKEPGRITLRGENGSGKSTTLMLLKNSLQEEAFILPTSGQLHFSTETYKRSTGENLQNRLTEILHKVGAPVLLLDEWDANLDQENREKLSSLIDHIAETKCVIEVRHR